LNSQDEFTGSDGKGIYLARHCGTIELVQTRSIQLRIILLNAALLAENSCMSLNTIIALSLASQLSSFYGSSIVTAAVLRTFAPR
jgi:hypothetical protein